MSFHPTGLCVLPSAFTLAMHGSMLGAEEKDMNTCSALTEFADFPVRCKDKYENRQREP